jgi:dihydrofolate reductase
MSAALEPLVLVVAVAKNGVIGKGGKLPWRIPEDLRHFRRTTEGHAIIMGRKTWDEVGKPLPNRRNLVVTRNRSWRAEGAEAFASVKDAIAAARTTDAEPRVIGGAQIFEEALPLATMIVWTEVNREGIEGDVSFPSFDRSKWRETARRIGEDPTVEFVTWERAT